MNPLSTAKNDYYNNRKNSTVYTPPYVSKFLYRITEPYHSVFSNILDPCVGTGNLLKPWYEDGFNVSGIDTRNNAPEWLDNFSQKDFLQSTLTSTYDLVVCNPPFNKDFTNNIGGRKLVPEVFLNHILWELKEHVPIILFAPMGFRLNQRVKSKRWKNLRDRGAEITSIVSMPLDVFPDVEFHNEILLFNMPLLKGHYFLPDFLPDF